MCAFYYDRPVWRKSDREHLGPLLAELRHHTAVCELPESSKHQAQSAETQYEAWENPSTPATPPCATPERACSQTIPAMRQALSHFLFYTRITSVWDPLGADR